MVNIYMGRRSCYAVNEGVYVSPGAMDLGRVAAHLFLHLRDFRRGWTYDHDCNRVAMDHALFEARSKYLVKLCREQLGVDEVCDEVEDLVDEVIRRHELPNWALELARKYLVRTPSLLDFS
ncbi:hypothetical protein [Vulcanisaeta thermophila]|uniref:hypothetical protein n=1 Tax=Vulcanisaeta thermophila TaxID=867917 RepID=UPI000852F8CA|nr:hypothetical protein [Vulcanisaeta thermophila]